MASLERSRHHVDPACALGSVESERAQHRDLQLPHARTRQLEEPPGVGGVHEVPRRAQHVRAQDLAGIDRGGHGCRIGSLLGGHPHGESPLRGQVLLRLHGHEPPHDLGRGGVGRPTQPLHPQPPAPQLGEVHGYDTSLRQVVAPPTTVATIAMPNSTRPPCHHSSDAPEPVDMML